MHTESRLHILAIAVAAAAGTAGIAPAQAQTSAAPEAKRADEKDPERSNTLPTVRARARADQGKDSVQATTTGVAKGRQDLRDLPQSITVVTEKLLDDRQQDTLREALRNTAGVTFLAAEGGEEDIRLRGFPLAATGDIFVDGMRDPAFYDRDVFFLDRMEVLRGSASLLFGRGSTGGAVNQVTKAPYLMTQHTLDVTLGSHAYLRTVGDFNIKLGDSTALRLGSMLTQAKNNGAGTPLDKAGMAAAFATGIGERHELGAALYWLENRNGVNYGLPYIRPTPSSSVGTSGMLPLDPAAGYALASDRNHGSAGTLTLHHTWRIRPGSELTTRVRQGRYERDLRPSTIRLAGAAQQPGGVAASLATFGPATVLTRGTPLKIQDLDLTLAQSDLSTRFDWLGMRHEVQAGADFAEERKRVYAARSAAQGGVNLNKPNTTVGAPFDGASVAEDTRVLRLANAYRSQGLGIYAQDLVQLRPSWKLLLGLRHDRLVGDYETYAIPNNAPGPMTTTAYRMTVDELSHRAGLLFQPNDRLSMHLGAATSFNTSGDAYSLSAQNVGVPPEKAINVELGARLESADGRFSARTSIFRSTKLHERNTDPLVNLVTLSGKRHAAGLELDLAGKPLPQWEVFASYLWLPVAVIDEGVPGAEGQGTRPSLTPVHSGTFWSTWQFTPKLRVGAGLNARGAQTPIRNPGFALPKFITGDLMAEYELVPRQLKFRLNVNNVTNELYANELYTGHYIPGAGRVVTLTGSWTFW